ncbi:MAG TPA: ATP-binding protein [Thermomicrobiaceae bacterium]|nr:ATP-binding protein [Thermomicrobiaceae bacterium]
MFGSVARRLAILNAAVVIVVVLLLGSVTFVALRHELNAEVDSSLRGRLEPVAKQWAEGGLSASGGQQAKSDDDHDDDEEALDSGDTVVFVVDPSGQVVYNPRGVQLGGVPVRAGIERALAGERDSRSVTVGGIGAVRVLSLPVRSHGQVVGAAQALRSLHEHQRELALLQGLTLLGLGLGVVIAVPAGLFLARRAMRPIDAAFTRQRTFVADASHELRTPLTLIRANAELALSDPHLPVAEVAPELTTILAEVDRTDRLVDDLLTLARADAGQLPLRREPHDLRALAATAAAGMSALAAARGLTVEVAPSPACPVWVDGERLLQVIRILLDNAIKHTGPGGTIQLVVSCGKEASLRVQDSGEGIAAGELEHVFDRFYRSDKARSRAAGGTGLGLAIARALVEAHGGRIMLDSQVGVGTVAEVTLPLRAGPAELGSTRPSR